MICERRLGGMADRRKVIKAVTICDYNNDGDRCKECPYRDTDWDGAWVDDATGESCYDVVRRDTLELLNADGEQYESGWNDAMDYAFMHGNGYKPCTYQNDNKEE